jgi:hypothetical protein
MAAACGYIISDHKEQKFNAGGKVTPLQVAAKLQDIRKF